MAVERLTDYTRRIWTALDADAPEGHDIHVNDVIYYMDSSECCIVTNVHPDGSIDCETLPDIGGGGGGYSQAGNWITEGGEFTTVSATATLSIPTSHPGSSVVALLVRITIPVANGPRPSEYGRTGCYASTSYINKAKFFNQSQLAVQGTGTYKETNTIDYWSNQPVTISTAGIITVGNTHTADIIVPAGVSYKWIAILEV